MPNHKKGEGKHPKQSKRQPQSRPLPSSHVPAPQHKARFGDLDELLADTDQSQDFQTLANAAVSADCHFVFESEKNWTLDSSKYDDLFAIDINAVAAIVKSIPFNEYINVDSRYFTKDELTDINNSAEQGKKAYGLRIESKPIENESLTRILDILCDTKKSTDTSEQRSSTNSENLEDDLEFLLSLKEPVTSHPASIVASTNNPKDLKPKKVPPVTKTNDLEKWLDSVLDD